MIWDLKGTTKQKQTWKIGKMNGQILVKKEGYSLWQIHFFVLPKYFFYQYLCAAKTSADSFFFLTNSHHTKSQQNRTILQFSSVRLSKKFRELFNVAAAYYIHKLPLIVFYTFHFSLKSLWTHHMRLRRTMLNYY